MTKQRPIVYILGVPGHYYVANALKEEFGRPLVGITNYARVEETLTDDKKAAFDEIYSFPDFYFKKLETEQDKSIDTIGEQIHALEKSLGIMNSSKMTHYDRALRWNADFQGSLFFQYCTLAFIDDFLSKVHPAFVLDGVTTYMQMAMRAACHHKNIVFPMTENSRYSGHINVSQADGRYIPMPQVFENLQGGNTPDASFIKEADEAFHKFVNKPVKPDYAVRNSALRFNPAKSVQNLISLAKLDQLFPTEAVQKLDRKMGYEKSPYHYLKAGVKGKYRRGIQKICNTLDSNPDLDIPFVYLPLHFAPENSDMYFGAAYDHHAGFVSQFAKHIPADCQLYAKEHPSMVGIRPTSFYDELNALYNVKVLSPAVDGFELIRKAKATVTVTGTAGWEAYLLGKPVVALGDVFYNQLPSVLYTDINPELTQKLHDYLENFKPDEQERLNAFRAFYSSCFVGTKGDIGPDISYDQVAQNSKLFAQSIRHVLKNHPESLIGSLPDDL